MIWIRLYSKSDLDRKPKLKEDLKQNFAFMVNITKMTFEMQNLLNPFKTNLKELAKSDANYCKVTKNRI